MRSTKGILFAVVLSTFLLSGCSPSSNSSSTDAPPAATIAPTVEAATAVIMVEPTATEIPTVSPTEEPTATTGLSADQVTRAEEILNTACAACHSPSKVTREHGDLAFWQQLVESMRQKGAEVSDDDALVLAQYLAQTYP